MKNGLPVTSKPQWRDTLALQLDSHGSSEISVFATDKIATAEHIATAIAKLSAAFPEMRPVFFNLLTERLQRNGFTSKRLDYVVNEVIDHYPYRILSIADIIGKDLRYKVYTYSEMCKEISLNGTQMEEFTTLWINDSDKPYWVRKSDKKRYNIPDKL